LLSKQTGSSVNEHHRTPPLRVHYTHSASVPYSRHPLKVADARII
jgi:hypothetical protein